MSLRRFHCFTTIAAAFNSAAITAIISFRQKVVQKPAAFTFDGFLSAVFSLRLLLID